jgi:transposase InsO family protein
VLRRPIELGQFTSWGFSERAVNFGLLPSVGTLGDCLDNAVIESFWSRVQVELLDRQSWKTRLQLSTAMFDYIEVFHNRQRRHSALGMLSPVEFELRFKQRTVAQRRTCRMGNPQLHRLIQ